MGEMDKGAIYGVPSCECAMINLMWTALGASYVIQLLAIGAIVVRPSHVPTSNAADPMRRICLFILKSSHHVQLLNSLTVGQA